MSYTTCEDALVSLIIANITGYTANNTKAGEAADAFEYAAQNATNACVVDFAGLVDDEQAPQFGAYEHVYYDCLVGFYIRYDESTIETSLRTLLNSFITMKRDNKRLTGNVTWRILEGYAFQQTNTKFTTQAYVPVVFKVRIKEPL